MGYDRINYGIHSICPFRISDGLPYGLLKVLGGGTLSMTSEYEELFGGSNKNAWAVEAKTISTEFSATVKSLPNFLFELFLGATVTETAASATGTVGALEAIKGALVAATGIASVAAKTGATADLKAGLYLVVAASATTVNVYALTDIDFKKLGAANILSYVNDDLLINAAPLTITMGGVTEILGLGVELTGGASAIAMVTGDSAMFHVAPAHNGMSEISIGSASTIFPEHRQLCLTQKRANGDIFEIELHRVIGSGFPLPMEENAFGVSELAMKLVYDSERDEVAKIRAIRG